MKHILLLTVLLMSLTPILAQDYELWGVTQQGGDNSKGTIYKTDSVGENHEVVYSFSDGNMPVGSLCLASNGLFYGITTFGGEHDMGIIYSYNRHTDEFTKILDLRISTGSKPRGSFMQASNGSLYLTTYEGGTNSNGGIIELRPSDNRTYLRHSFGENATDPREPLAGELVEASNGLLYGVTRDGGQYNGGTIYSFDPTDNTVTKLYDFSSASNGSEPLNSLLLASDGMLYGMTFSGGPTNKGGIFLYDIQADTFSRQVMFTSTGTAGTKPQGALIEAADGKFYGTTSTPGHLFSFDPATRELTSLHATGDIRSTLLEASNGKLYGTTYNGSLFEYDIATDAYNVQSSVGNYSLYGALIEVSNQPLATAVTVSAVGGSSFIELNGSLQMEARIDPGDAVQEATWTVQNGSGQASIDISTGVLTGVSLGTVTVVATAADGSNVTGEKEITVVESLGVDHLPETPFSIVPNPARDRIFVNTDGLKQVSIFDLAGSLVLSSQAPSLNIASLDAGIYMVMVETKGSIHSAKLVKQ